MLKFIALGFLVLAPIVVMALGCSKASPPPKTAAHHAAQPEAAAPSGNATDVQLINNRLCPITGEPVGSMEAGAHVDYSGQRVGLCCSGCANSFHKDPEAYLAKAKADASTAS